jgi:hypothetical protein
VNEEPTEPPPEDERGRAIDAFKKRMHDEAEWEAFEQRRANRDQHRNPDPPVDDPVRELLARRVARRRLLHRHRRVRRL